MARRIRRSPIRLRTALTVLCAASTLACGAGPGDAGDRAGAPARDAPASVMVAAAADLAAALPDLVGAFERQTGLRVETTIASSGQLAHQIRHGAPIDVFAAADRDWIRQLEAEGRIDPETVGVYALGGLALVMRVGGPEPAELATLADPAVRRVAIPNPEYAPYGRAAMEVLTRVGIRDVVEPKLIFAENLRQVMQLVETGNVDAVLTGHSLARGWPGAWTSVPDSLHAPLEQAVGVVSGTKNPDAARAFVRFLLGPEGRAILARHGFALPGDVGE